MTSGATFYRFSISKKCLKIEQRVNFEPFLKKWALKYTFRSLFWFNKAMYIQVQHSNANQPPLTIELRLLKIEEGNEYDTEFKTLTLFDHLTTKYFAFNKGMIQLPKRLKSGNFYFPCHNDASEYLAGCIANLEKMTILSNFEVQKYPLNQRFSSLESIRNAYFADEDDTPDELMMYWASQLNQIYSAKMVKDGILKNKKIGNLSIHSCLVNQSYVGGGVSVDILEFSNLTKKFELACKVTKRKRFKDQIGFLFTKQSTGSTYSLQLRQDKSSKHSKYQRGVYIVERYQKYSEEKKQNLHNIILTEIKQVNN